jgi:hypothetical protein
VAYRPVAGQRPLNNKTTAVAMQRHSKHASTTIELLLEMVFCTQSMQRGYKEDNWGDPVSLELSSTWEAVKIEPECMKLKNPQC